MEKVLKIFKFLYGCNAKEVAEWVKFGTLKWFGCGIRVSEDDYKEV